SPHDRLAGTPDAALSPRNRSGGGEPFDVPVLLRVSLLQDLSDVLDGVRHLARVTHGYEDGVQRHLFPGAAAAALDDYALPPADLARPQRQVDRPVRPPGRRAARLLVLFAQHPDHAIGVLAHHDRRAHRVGARKELLGDGGAQHGYVAEAETVLLTQEPA